MNAIDLFHQKLTEWSGQISRDYNPAMNPGVKNRLQAIGEIRSKVVNSDTSNEFSNDIAKLMSIVQECQADFDPMFDTEYGSGRNIHSQLIGLLQSANSAEAFESCWENILV